MNSVLMYARKIEVRLCDQCSAVAYFEVKWNVDNGADIFQYLCDVHYADLKMPQFNV